MNNIGEVLQTILIGLLVSKFLAKTRRFLKAIELCKECLLILDNTPLIKEKNRFESLYKEIYRTMLFAYSLIHDCKNATKYVTKILHIVGKSGKRLEECSATIILARLYLHQSKYVEAEEHSKKALLISTEIDYQSGEALCYGILGEVYQLVGKYEKAKEYHLKALDIRKEIGDKYGEAFSYEKLGKVFRSVGKYERAKEYYERALAMNKEIGDRDGEATGYGLLGTVFESVGEYRKAKEFHEKALLIKKKMGNKNGEAWCYGNLGNVCQSLSEYEKAKEYHKKALTIQKETGDRQGEASSYGNIGTVHESRGELEKAKEYLQVALAIKKEIGDRAGEASSYANLGIVFQSVGEYAKATEYYEKAVAIGIEIGDLKGEGSVCGNLGTLFLSLGKYAKANDYLQKALALSKEIGDKTGEAFIYGNLGSVFQSIGEYKKAREHFKMALTISKEIGDRYKEALLYGNLGTVFQFLGEYADAEEHYKSALAISEEIGSVMEQSRLLCSLGWLMLLAGKIQEALSYLLSGIQKCEDLRGFLRDNDQFKISFSDKKMLPYLLLIVLFSSTGNPIKALYASELGRARTLADLMSSQYSLENQISANPQSWIGIERVMNKEPNCTCLYFSYFSHHIFFWILLKAKGVVHFRKVNGKEIIVHEGLIKNLDEFFANEHYRSFRILAEEHCEDRSLNDVQWKPCEEYIRKASRTVGNNGKDNQDSLTRYLSLCHKLIIAPVVDLIEGREIIIVPERSLYNIPISALPDECGKNLSETFRIRIVPSLTTLKLIQDSPADYHSQTGALIVGNPDVGRVRYKGRQGHFATALCGKRSKYDWREAGCKSVDRKASN